MIFIATSVLSILLIWHYRLYSANIEIHDLSRNSVKIFLISSYFTMGTGILIQIILYFPLELDILLVYGVIIIWFFSTLAMIGTSIFNYNFFRKK